MKNDTKKNRTKHRNGGGPPAPVVHLEFTHPTAASVCVAGTFNDWRPEVTPMIPIGEGRWAKELALPPGTYEYCVVVDGAFLPDPLTQEIVPNPFGGVNSVVRVSQPRPEPSVAPAERSNPS